MDDRNAVLVVEDDAAIAKVVCALLGAKGLDTVWVATAEAAVRELSSGRPFDVVLSDVRLPGMDGLALLDHVTTHAPEVPVVLVTAHGSVALAVDAMKRGAADFVQKPFDRDELAFVVGKALETSRRARSAPPPAPAPAHGLVGDAPAVRDLLATVKKVASTTATVLVRGETGTGKELVARAIHTSSPRAHEPFVRVHCAALPEALLESELFGHERGAFTGATQRKPGRFELAHRGTLFLDEIGDISPAVQVKLLRVLQEREFERVGGTEVVRVDVRIVAATHRDLESMVAAGTFREDLFYRLAVVPLTVPPLRERPGDVMLLARHFAATAAKAFGRPSVALDDAALRRLAGERWPGNVRQLQNFVERLVALGDGKVVDEADVEHELARTPGAAPPKASAENVVSLDAKRRDAEKAALLLALDRARNNRTQAARILGVSRRTIYNMLRAHGVE